MPVFSFVRPGVCHQALEKEGAENGGGAGVSKGTSEHPQLLETNVDPYGKGVPRELHETEREGQLYGLGEKFNSKVDEEGKSRRDGRYLFVVARDVDGARRVMVVPRFDFDRVDEKYLSTHRSMFRKYADVFGPHPQIEVMGELEIRKGTVVAYNNKAGTAFDLNEAKKPELFQARKNIAESMGIDLSHASRVVNYAEIVNLEPKEQAQELGRHLDEVVYVETVKAMRAHPMTKKLLDKFDDLIHRAYALSPEVDDPKRILSFKSPLLKDFDEDVDGGFLVRVGTSQEDSPVVSLRGSIINREEGALEFARDLDLLERIVLHGENKKKGISSPKVASSLWGPLEQEFASMLSDSTDTTYQTMRSKVFELSGKEIDPIEARKNLKVGVWRVKDQQRALLERGYAKSLMETQLLLSNVQTRFAKADGSFDFEKFSKEVNFLEEDQFLDEGVAKQMLYNILIESRKPDGDPVKLYDTYRKEAENAPEEEIEKFPNPSFVVGSFLRALNLRLPEDIDPIEDP